MIVARRGPKPKPQVIPPHILRNYRKKFDAVAEELGIKTHSEWFKVSKETITSIGGPSLLFKYFQGSLWNSLKTIYPEFQWHPWLFPLTTRNIWNMKEHRKSYLDWLGEYLGFNTQEDWYSLQTNIFHQTGASALLDTRNSKTPTFTKMLKDAYPEFDWFSWKFTQVPQNFWGNKNNHRVFLDWVSEECGIHTYEDWHHIRAEDVAIIGGRTMLDEYYGGSLASALKHVYPQYEWTQWHFVHPPKHTWLDSTQQRSFFDWIAQQLEITSPVQWYKVNANMIVELGGAGCLKHFGHNVIRALQSIYPEHDWVAVFGLSEGHVQVSSLLQTILKGFNILQNYKHPMLIHSATERKMELDMYIPSLQLAFEYQGAQHYTSAAQERRDEVKRELCKQIGISLVEVPFWWDASRWSLIATIQRHRPDLQFLCLDDDSSSLRNNWEVIQ